MPGPRAYPPRLVLTIRAVALAFGVRFTGFVAGWPLRTYYLFQMPRWDRR